MKPRAIRYPHQPPNQGDNTVSVAQGGTATPGATKQLLPPDRVFNIYIYIYIYIRQINLSRHYIGRSFIFILAQFLILKCVYFRPLMSLQPFLDFA